VRLGLLQDRCEDVAGVHLGALRALDVQYRRLQDAPESRRLFRLALLAAPQLFDRRVQILVQLTAQPRQIRAAGRENALALAVVGQGVEQVLERQVGVPPGHRLAIRDRQDDFDRSRKHGPG
jgi:hypothetical protein